ncbi:uncharacterized protein LOC129270314 isoform X2 [Lytechinus pictus]|uniref:uncharacterized protein LOC129270314 isoform X2 n=1 Tax=Lytechinus pictus TaxID=7653 RepID=UPI0030B9E522
MESRTLAMTVAIFCVLGGMCFAQQTDDTVTGTAEPTATGNTSTDAGTTSTDAGNTGTDTTSTSTSTSNDQTSGTGNQCLSCDGDADSNCNEETPTSSMAGVSAVGSCSSCGIRKLDSGEGTDLVSIERVCNDEACPSDLSMKLDFRCLEGSENVNDTARQCEWCCTGDKCNDYNENSGNALVAGIILSGWPPNTKFIYVIVTVISLVMSFSTMSIRV